MLISFNRSFKNTWYSSLQRIALNGQMCYRFGSSFKAGSTPKTITFNEIFTEQELAMQMKFGSVQEETNHLHTSFNERFLSALEEPSKSQSNSFLKAQANIDYQHSERNGNGNQICNNSQQNLRFKSNNHQTHHSPTSIFSRRNFSLVSIQEVIRSIEEAATPLEKFQVVNSYCMSLRINHGSGLTSRDMDGKSRSLLFEVVKPLLKSISINPSQYDQSTMFAMLNMAREDFLNIRLHGNVMNEINKIIQVSYTQFDIGQIKLFFFAYVMRQKESHTINITPNIIRAWTNVFVTQVVEEKVQERELIHFLGFFSKDQFVFKKYQSLVSQILLDSFKSDGLLMQSKSSELIRQIVVLFVKCESTTHTSLDGFIQVLLEKISFLIQSGVIDIQAFHIILRYLLRSNSLVADRIISSYDFTKPDDTENNKIFSVIDRFVCQHMDQLLSNQAFNILNLYQLVNAQNYRSTTLKLLDRIQTTFNNSCDNYCSFNIAVRSICLFKPENPEKIISLFKTWFQSKSPVEGSAQYSKTMAQSLAILKYALPRECISDSHLKLFQELLKSSNQNQINEESKNYPYQENVLPQTPASVNKKRFYITEIQKIINIIPDVHCLISQNFEYLPVDFVIWNSEINQNSKKTKVFALKEFALDILSSQDYMSPSRKILNGPLTLKYEILNQMQIPTVQLTEEFVKDILSIQTQSFQVKLLISNINKIIQIQYPQN